MPTLKTLRCKGGAPMPVARRTASVRACRALRRFPAARGFAAAARRRRPAA